MKMSKIQQNEMEAKQLLEEGKTVCFRFKWSVSRGRETYGYNICSLYADGLKIATCNGGGYDMEGTCYGEFINNCFTEELKELVESGKGFYGIDRGCADGGTGLNVMIKFLEAIGFKCEYHWSRKEGTYYYISKQK